MVQDAIGYFHPDRRYDKCLPSMMEQQRTLIQYTVNGSIFCRKYYHGYRRRW
jgi:hypothetical protein